MNSKETEAEYQLNLHATLLGEGRKLLEDSHNLEDKIGTVQKVKVRFGGTTPKGLLRFYIEGEPNPNAFHLIRPTDLVPNAPMEMGKIYEYEFVIGVRRVSNPEDGGYVISLRLPKGGCQISKSTL